MEDSCVATGTYPRNPGRAANDDAAQGLCAIRPQDKTPYSSVVAKPMAYFFCVSFNRGRFHDVANCLDKPLRVAEREDDMLSIGCWWIRDGLNARRREARRFAERLDERPDVR